ncbi:hemerythrin domain-containing protein [Uruburuella testudinis]|uniref:Hemerythrin domain-containing protein n=1 Tax=Uruburuella testudinis TaxID=1282863 RepID=A0ABY4DT24_9NEIS|nr:hemerythrin domain-containing protein [Uruburuella testudinis]UOO81159.1 hemerythrin domain-containing protein [Uruburuella testudinis]
MKPLKRHPDLIERSREHHHSLALCVRILRDPAATHQTDIEAHRPDLLAHFQAEEQQFAPHWPALDEKLRSRFEADHAGLRDMLAHPQYQNSEWNRRLAVTLRDHARFEERELFPAIEPFLDTP